MARLDESQPDNLKLHVSAAEMRRITRALHDVHEACLVGNGRVASINAVLEIFDVDIARKCSGKKVDLIVDTNPLPS